MAFVIKEHRPGRWWIILGAVIVVWIASGWFAYQAGLHRLNYDHDLASTRRQSLQEELNKLRDANRQLQTQVSILQRSAQVDRQAKIELAREAGRFQDRQAKLKEEISFYKNIISPDAGKVGLGIYSFSVMQAEGRLYHYKLVLTQSGKSDNLALGEVEILMNGILQGKEKRLDLGDIQVADAPKLSYKFRYFQELSGSIRLPEGFSPRDVVVKLIPDSKKVSNKPVKTFDWQKVRL